MVDIIVSNILWLYNPKIHNINSKTIENFDRDINHLHDKYTNKIRETNPNQDIPSSCEKEFNEYYGELKALYDKHFIDTVDMSTKRNLINKPWISIGLAKASKVKNKLHNDLIFSLNYCQKQFESLKPQTYYLLFVGKCVQVL